MIIKALKFSETSPSSDDGRAQPRITRGSDGYILAPKSSSVTRLNLVMSVVSCSLLGRLLTLPAALESFRYVVGSCTVGTEPFLPSRFLPGLLTQARSLKELIVDTQYADNFDGDEPLLGSLTQFCVLERLALPVSMLLQPGQLSARAQNPLDELLPSSLVTLELDLDNRWSGGLTQFLHVTGIPQTLPASARRLSNLRKIVLGNSKGTTRIWEEVSAEASRLCPHITIEMKVRISLLFLFPLVLTPFLSEKNDCQRLYGRYRHLHDCSNFFIPSQ